jgi:phytoene/squalene synthetase
MMTNLGSSITKAASSQTFYTIRYLADRERIDDAYRAYGYFRWVDDTLDSDSGSKPERLAFLERQKSLLESCYRGEALQEVTSQEKILVELVANDTGNNSGLQMYLRNMMLVMDFDARRRGRFISQVELNGYTRWLAVAVTEAMHYFIGHDDYAPHDEARYLAVSAAHIAHMLRDAFEDVRAGYYNIPREVLQRDRFAPKDIQREADRAWVKSRVLLAREYFKAGKDYFRRVQNWRCRLASFAYMARFEWFLDTLEEEDYNLRPQYNERKSAATGLRMAWLTLSSLVNLRGVASPAQHRVPHPLGKI